MALDAAQAAGHKDNGIIDFEGLPNTRDLGGMPAADGRRIKPRRLLRSGLLARATATDLARLRDEYDLRLDIDLRTDVECSERPDPMDALPNTRLAHLPVFQEPAAGVSRSNEDMERVQAQVMRGEVEPAQLMIVLYSHVTTDEYAVKAYRAFFQEILNCEEGAVLWHCTAGKDRCGMGSVLMEVALGVPWEVVKADYLATNRFYGIDPATCSPMDALNAVDERYLMSAVDAMNRQYGSVEAYLERALGVDEEAREVLRSRYLQES